MLRPAFTDDLFETPRVDVNPVPSRPSHGVEFTI